ADTKYVNSGEGRVSSTVPTWVKKMVPESMSRVPALPACGLYSLRVGTYVVPPPERRNVSRLSPWPPSKAMPEEGMGLAPEKPTLRESSPPSPLISRRSAEPTLREAGVRL